MSAFSNNGFCVWFTGYPYSGKASAANLLSEQLLERGLDVEILNAKDIQDNLFPEFIPSRQDHAELTRRIGFLTQKFMDHGLAVIVVSISPDRKSRDKVRESMDHFIEVHIDYLTEAPFAAGPDIAYEAPEKPEVRLSASLETEEEKINTIMRTLEIMKLVPAMPTDDEYTKEEQELIRKRLEDLGYV